MLLTPKEVSSSPYCMEIPSNKSPVQKWIGWWGRFDLGNCLYLWNISSYARVGVQKLIPINFIKPNCTPPTERRIKLISKSQQSTECYDKIFQACKHSTILSNCIRPHFQYCFVAGHLCSSRNSEKLESLNKRALRVVFNVRKSTYSQLLDRAAATSLYN